MRVFRRADDLVDGGEVVRDEFRVADIFVHDVVFFSSRRRHTRLQGDWSSDVCSSDLTGPMLEAALSAGVLSSGSNAVHAGLVSTPTLARGARSYACGVMITASHNPAPYNGIKLWNPDGMAFDEEQQREIEEALDCVPLPAPSWDRMGSESSHPDLVAQHVDAILKDVGTTKGRVVVDCSCGATCTITPLLRRKMGWY